MTQHILGEMGASVPTNNNMGPWNDWLLSDGLYAKAQFRF